MWAPVQLRPGRVPWFLWTLGVTLVFGALAARDLANFRPVSNDEVELVAVGYKLATRGILGSDMYVGFFGADQHQLWTLPVQHVLDAAAFRVIGAGIAEARWVSVVAACATIWLVGWLTYRWYGLAAAVLCELLLTVWPSDLTASATGLPLLDVARTARYDVLAVAFAWLAVWLLDATRQRPTPWLGLLCGLSAGAATLSQFFGAFVVPLIAIDWLWCTDRPKRQTIGWIAAGIALVVGPWILVCAANASDLAGQLLVYGNRGNFLEPGFYLRNIMAEPGRYAHLLAPPNTDLTAAAAIAGWISRSFLVLGVWAAALYGVRRSLLTRGAGDRLLISSLAAAGGLLLVLDTTKTPLYAIVLVPSICMALAATWSAAMRYAWRRSGRLASRVTTALLTIIVLLSVGWTGVRAYLVDRAEAHQVTPYMAVGRQIQRSVPTAAIVFGPERWWWALHDHPYVSLRNIWFQWVAAARSSPQPPRFVDWVQRLSPDIIIVNNNVLGDVRDFPESLQAQFSEFVSQCTNVVATLDDPTYFETEIHQVIRPAPSGCA